MGAKKLERSQSELYLEQALREGKATRTELSIRAIKADTKYQSRVETDPEHIKHLASLMDLGIELRPVVVFRDPANGTLRLADGFHRVGAHRKAIPPRDSILAYVIEGTKRDLILYSAGANLENSKPASREDRRKAVLMLLEDPEIFRWNDRAIARQCGVHKSTASKIRQEFCIERKIPVPEKRIWIRSDGVIQHRVSRKKAQGVPRYVAQLRDNKLFAYMRVGSVNKYLGPDGPQAREKFEVEKGKFIEEQAKVVETRGHLRSTEAFARWLMARDVVARCFSTHSSWSFPGLVVADVAFAVPMAEWKAEAIFWAVGMCLLFRESEGPDLQSIVACYPDHRGADPLVEAARHLGIELLTPEGVVAEFGPKDGAAP